MGSALGYGADEKWLLPVYTTYIDIDRPSECEFLKMAKVEYTFWGYHTGGGVGR